MVPIKSQFYTSPGFIKYFNNSSWLVGEKVIRLFTGLFINLYVARYLGPQNYGILNYVLSFVALFGVIAPLGLDEIVIKELIKNEEDKNSILGTAFVLKFFGAVTTIVLVSATFLFPINDYQTNYYIFIIVLNLIFQPFYVIDFYFQSQVQAKYLVKANILSLIITSIIRIILVYLKAPLVYFIWVSFVDSIIIAIGLMFFYRSLNLKVIKWEYCYRLGKNLLDQSWPLIISGIVIMIYIRIDQVMLKQLIGFEAVGIYSAAVRVSELWYFIPMAIGGSLFPAIVNAKKLDENLYHQRLMVLLNIMVLISLPTAIIVTFFSENIILILFGKSFIEAASVLSIHIWTGIFVFIGVISGKYLIIEGLTMVSLYRSLFGAIANVILNLILIPVFGIIGAAISTLVAQIIAAYLFDFFNKKTRKLFYMKTKALLFIGFFNNLKAFYHGN